MQMTLVKGNGARNKSVSLIIEIASPATALALWPGTAPFTAHTGHVLTTTHFAPIVLTVSVASVPSWDLGQVIA